jgi:peptide/nickel transport system permease protein
LGRYVIRRLLWTILVIVVVTFLSYVIFFLLPSGDPAARFAGKQPTPELIAEVRRQMNFDKPWPQQYVLYLKNFVLGDEYGWPGFGYSFNQSVPIRPELLDRAKITLSLIGGGALLWLAIGIPVGVISAVKRRSKIDRITMGLALFFVSAPVFWLALLSLYIFWNKLGWLPGTGYVPFDDSPKDWFLHMVQPWMVLALLFAAIYARLVRGNMVDTLSEDYIRTARAKGLSENRVVYRHALRSSLTPVISLLAIDLGVLVGGTIVTESVFNLQGLGQWVLVGTNDQDLPVTLAVTVLVALVVSLMSLVGDIVYAYLDPRVRYK